LVATAARAYPDGMGEPRRFVHPRPGDTIAAIAERELPGVAGAADQLLAWNLHLAMRTFAVGAPGEVLPSDVVYVEPPAA
jgi:hypothetical protein